MFVDERNITIASGKGGNGVVHWHREKFIAKGGPDGGDGGDGGDAYIVAVRDVRALERYSEGESLKAEDGEDGAGKLRKGKRGRDLEVPVPLGSVVVNKQTREIFNLLKEGQKQLVAAGGYGGYGNAHFKSSVQTTPTTANPGGEAQRYAFNVELHMIADVGIIGLPSAGKSTLLNTLTQSSAKVGAYPFTTLEPNLGMFHSYVLADIPGLIENASQGRGLGHKFLKHIQRTNILVHLISAEEKDPLVAYETVRKELELFDPKLLEKKEIVVLSKVDTVEEHTVTEMLSRLPEGALPLSVLDDTMVKEFSRTLSQLLTESDT